MPHGMCLLGARTLVAITSTRNGDARIAQLFILTIATFVAGLGIYGLACPGGLAAFAGFWRTPTALWLAAALRLIFGMASWTVAPVSQAPLVLRVVAIISIMAAVVLPLLGVRGLGLLLDWWAGQSIRFLRAWSALALFVGFFLLWAVAS